MQNCNSKFKSFTLVELLVVVAILGLLAAILLPAINHARAKARDARRMTDVDSFAGMLELYLNTNNAYPVWSSGGCTTDSSNPLTTALVDGGHTGSLPEDPRDNLYCYYYESDSTGSMYKVAVKLEVDSDDRTSNDGGTADSYYEKYSSAGMQTSQISLTNDDLDKIQTNWQNYNDSSVVGEWKMDEDSWDGTTGEVDDESAYQNNGTAGCTGVCTIPTTTGTDCISDRCGDFDGVDDYVTLGGPSSLNFADDDGFTVSFWMKRGSGAGQSPMGDRSSNKGWQFYGSETSLWFYVGDGTGSVNNNFSISIDTWVHVTGVYQHNTERFLMYKNGALQNDNSAIYSFLDDTSPTAIGSENGFNVQFFNGIIDEVKIYNRALSECQVCERCRTHWTKSQCSDCTNCLGS